QEVIERLKAIEEKRPAAGGGRQRPEGPIATAVLVQPPPAPAPTPAPSERTKLAQGAALVRWALLARLIVYPALGIRIVAAPNPAPAPNPAETNAALNTAMKNSMPAWPEGAQPPIEFYKLIPTVDNGVPITKTVPKETPAPVVPPKPAEKTS